MKKHLFAIGFILHTVGLFALVGDTTVVIGHQKTHWTWYGNYDVNVGFPSQEKSYEKVLLEFTIGCPEGGCSEWDYFSKISARLKTGEQDTNHVYDSNGVLSIDTFDLFYEVELARLITPYAGNYPNTWERTYYYDVTDFQSVLKDSVILRAFYDGWQDGWLISTKFLFIEGTPSRDVLGFDGLWTGRYTYGEPYNPIENQVTPIILSPPANAKQAKLRVTTTGHRFGGALNCAEFCIKTHKFVINNTDDLDQYLWRTDCGMNPEYPQAGTWLYDRAGWCPGAPVQSYNYDLTSYLNGADITIDYQFEDYLWDNVNPPAPYYYIGSALIYYGSPNFQNDAEILDIVSPSKAFIHSRYNPICGDPVIVLKNNGANEMTSCKILYGMEGYTSVEFLWEGNLAYLESDTISLKTYADRAHLWQGAQENGTFFARIIEVNGTNDEYDNNNEAKSKVALPPVYPRDFFIRFKTNAAALETTFKLFDQVDSVILTNRDSMKPRTTYDTLLRLETGCYLLKVEDSAKDGADFWANNDGKGRLELRTNLDDILPDLKSFDLDFGTALYHQFRVAYSLDVNSLEINNYYIGPNPSEGNIYIQSKDYTHYRVFNPLGQLLKSGLINYAQSLDLSIFNHSFLFIELSNDNSRVVEKVIIR